MVTLWYLKHRVFAVSLGIPFCASMTHQLSLGGPRSMAREVRRSWAVGRYTNGFRLILRAEKSTEGPLGLLFATCVLFYTTRSTIGFANALLSMLSSAYGIS